MSNIQIYRENVFTQIAKLLALAQIKKELPKAIDEFNDNPEMQASLESMKFHADRVEKLLKSICKDDPDYPKCKELNKGK